MRLELLVGNIASGKSTYCRQAAEMGKIIVNDDSIVNSLHAGNYKLYDKDLKPLYKSVENTVVHNALSMGRTVVIDRPNVRRRARQRYIGLAKSLDAEVAIIMFKQDALEIHASRRADGDSRGYNYDYWLDVAAHFQSIYEAPDEATEYFDEVVNWEWPGLNFSAEAPQSL